MESFFLKQIGSLQILVCNPLEELGFINGFSTRVGGVSPLPEASLSLGSRYENERENVLENRRRFLSALGAPDYKLVTAMQIHSADVCSIRDLNDAVAEPSTCDALTSNIDKVLLAAQTADCLPVLIVDKKNKAFAAVHAGWRGTVAGIVGEAISTMQRLYDSQPSDMFAALGPAIGKCCFQIGPEVISQFQSKCSYTNTLLSRYTDEGKANFDNNKANFHQLLDCGLNSENIFDCGLCTVCRNDLFFSYRFENGAANPVGRLMGVIGKKP